MFVAISWSQKYSTECDLSKRQCLQFKMPLKRFLMLFFFLLKIEPLIGLKSVETKLVLCTVNEVVFNDHTSICRLKFWTESWRSGLPFLWGKRNTRTILKSMLVIISWFCITRHLRQFSSAYSRFFLKLSFFYYFWTFMAGKRRITYTKIWHYDTAHKINAISH